MAKKTTSASKENPKLKACNDPTRDDWNVLSRLTGVRQSPEGLTPEQAKHKLEGLLLVAYGVSPKKLVASATAAHGNLDDLKTSLNFRTKDELLENIASRLLLPEDGRDRPVAKVNLEKGKGSSYRMLEYWEADRLGVIPYLRCRIKHITNGMTEENELRNRHVSFTTLEATNTEVQIGSDGMGMITTRQRNHDFAEGSDIQELHDGGHEIDDLSRIPANEAAADMSELSGGGGGSRRKGGKVEQLESSHESVKMLTRLLDSADSETGNHSPLFDERFVEMLADNDITLTTFNDLSPLMAEQGQAESAEELHARVTAELQIASEIVTNMGGIHLFPDDVAQRLTELRPELAKERDALPEDGANEPVLNLDDGDSREPKVVAQAKSSQTSEQRMAYAFAQTRKHLLAFDKPNRPEFELFGLLLGQRIVPAESPEARNLQLLDLAKKIAKEKCEGMNTPEDKAIGATIEDAVAEWDPSSSGFGRRFPDALEHLENQETLALEKRAANALAAAQARVAAKAGPAAGLKVEADGQVDFYQSMAVLTGIKDPAIEALKDIPEDNARPRRIVGQDRDAKTIEEIIRTPEMHEAFAVRNALETDFWTAVCSEPDDLNNAERIDYRFLCAKLGVKPDHDMADENLHAQVKEMATTWTQNLVTAREKANRLAGRLNLDANGGKVPLEVQFNKDLKLAVERYNPAEDGYFSQALNEFLRDQLQMDAARRKRGPRAPVVTEESVDMHVITPPHAEENPPAAVPGRKGGKTDYAD